MSKTSPTARRKMSVLALIASVAVIASCSSGSSTKATTTAAPGGSTPAAGSEPAGGTPADGNSAAAFADPCGLVTLAQVQVVLTGAPAGDAPVISASASMCNFTIDAEHYVRITLATGPTATMEATKKSVAAQGYTTVAGLGDVAYTFTQGTRLDVHFFQGDVEVLISAVGQVGGADAFVTLAKAVSASL